MYRPLKALMLVTLLAGPWQAPALGQGQNLRILLTNDDGFDAPGLVQLQTTLRSAGHTVVVVAPAENQSSAGTRLTNTAFRLERKADGVWAVYGTPSDSVLVGLKHILKNTPPDIVLSGINPSPNTGVAFGSGTVAAAVTATVFGVPAIAVSGRSGPAELPPAKAYRDVGQVVVRVLAQVCSNRCVGVLPPGVLLSINHPPTPTTQTKGVIVVPAVTSSRFSYRQVSESELRMQIELGVNDRSFAGESDVAAFGQGYVTIAPMRVIGVGTSGEFRTLSRRLARAFGARK